MSLISPEDLMRSVFREVAEPVVPEPEPLRRLQVRRARQDRRRLTAAGVVALLLATAAVMLPGRLEQQSAGFPITSEWVHALIDSPTRGNLAGHEELLNDVRGLAERRGSKSLNQTRILYLGDVAGRRFVAYVRYDGTRAALYWHDVEPGDSVKHLVEGGTAGAPVTPLIRMQSPEEPVIVALAPSACEFATTTSGEVAPDGTVRRSWRIADGPAGLLEAAGYRGEQRWRITCAGKVRFEGPANPVDQPPQGDLVADAALVGEPLAKRWTGSANGRGEWTLWTSRLVSGGSAVVVAAGTSIGGLALTTGFAPVTNPPGGRLMSTAISPSQDIVAARVPEYVGSSAHWGSTLIVAGPPGAWTAEISDYLPTKVPLLEGVGMVTIPGPVHGTIVAKDVEGKVLGTMSLDETGDFPRYFGEPVIDAW